MDKHVDLIARIRSAFPAPVAANSRIDPDLICSALHDPERYAHPALWALRPIPWDLYHEGDDFELRAEQSALSTDQYSAVCAFLGAALVDNHWPHLAAQALRWG